VKLVFFNKVRDGYLQLAEDFSDKFLVLNAEDSQQQNFKKASEWLDLAKS
jgi:thymidylate kinase